MCRSESCNVTLQVDDADELTETVAAAPSTSISRTFCNLRCRAGFIVVAMVMMVVMMPR